VSSPQDRPRRAAECLKEAREGRGLSVRQVADATKLSTRVIEDLERGKAASLPPGVYRRSLVRAVAREVGLDPEPTLRMFLDEFPDDLPPPGCAVLAEPVNPAPRAALARLLAVLGAAVPLAAGVWYFSTVHESQARDVVRPAPSQPAESPTPEVLPIGGFFEPPPPSIRPVTMLITVSARCHLIVLADGRLVANRGFVPGESLQVAFSDTVELTGDNAGVVQYSLNGRGGRLLGAAGDPLSARISRDDYTSYLSGR
jgi:cytoskeletal protein RodZ